MTTETTQEILHSCEKSKISLKSYRTRAGLSLQDVSNQIKLTANFIKALESDNPLALNVAPIYIHGHFYAYCKYLKIPQEETHQLAEQLKLNYTTTQTSIINQVQTTSKLNRIKNKLSQQFFFWKQKSHE